MAKPNQGGMSYQIQPGDTLSSIASKHNTSVGSLLSANPSIKNPNLIRAGASLNIPFGSTPTEHTQTSTGIAKGGLNISSFTPQQKQAFDNAASLGSGVKTTTGIVGGQPQFKNTITGYSPTGQAQYTSGTGQSPTPSAPPGDQIVPAGVKTVTPGTYGTGSPSALGATQTPTGILGNLISTAEANYQKTRKQQEPIIQSATNQIADLQRQQDALAGGGFVGTNADYAGRLGQLENLKQQAQANATRAQTAVQNAQNAVQSAYGTGLSAALPKGNYPFVFNPLTGAYTFAGGGSTGSAASSGLALTGNYANDISNAVDTIMHSPSLYSSYANALDGLYGNTAKSQLDAGLIKNGANPTDFQAQSSALASNIQAGGTAAVNAYNTIYQNSTNKAATYGAAQSNINDLGNAIFSLMNNTPGINPSDANFLNTPINQLNTEFNSPTYYKFNAEIAGLQRTVANYIQQGEIPTAATNAAKSIVNGGITVGALGGALQGLDQDLTSAQQAQNLLGEYARGQIQANSGATGGTGGGSTGQSQTSQSTPQTSSGAASSWGSLTY